MRSDPERKSLSCCVGMKWKVERNGDAERIFYQRNGEERST